MATDEGKVSNFEGGCGEDELCEKMSASHDVTGMRMWKRRDSQMCRRKGAKRNPKQFSFCHCSEEEVFSSWENVREIFERRNLGKLRRDSLSEGEN